MKGDFSRDTFNPLRHFSRVLAQQGRLQLDADSNEQSAILLHYLRTLARDLIGPYGGPDAGFSIGVGAGLKLDFLILAGRYYVDGILCENERTDLTYATQAAYRADRDAIKAGETHFVYLDVWERHVSSLDDDAIHDVALGRADTMTRAQVMWQVRVAARTPDDKPLPIDQATDWNDWLNKSGWPDKWQSPNRGQLKAMARAAVTNDPNPCILSPDARFRGLENQLYRVEIHSGGTAAAKTATFKWSRDNGSVVFALTALDGAGKATLAEWGRGDCASLTRDDWVEVVDDDVALRGEAGPLAVVTSVQPDDGTVMLQAASAKPLPAYASGDYATKHVQLRRWDYKNKPGTSGGNRPKPADDGALLIEEGDSKWLALEDGVQVLFTPAPAGAENEYRTGDYWLIPARTAAGDIEWPGMMGNPQAQGPRGVEHHYAPLGIIGVKAAEVGWMASFRKTLNL